MSINYNGIEFGSNILTTRHVYGPERDPSGTDQLFTVFYIAVRGQLNPNYLPAIPGESPEATCVRIRHMLTEPRCAFYMDTDSVPGVQNSPNPLINLPDGRDDANGPWPDSNAITVHFTLQGTYDFTWAVTVKLRDCGSVPVTDPLSLRWEDSIALDDTWKMTYTRIGTLIISSKQANNIDWFRRNRLALNIPAGFKRVNSRYTISRDGLRCDFILVDDQICFAPPYPGVELDILQSESAPTLGGMKRGAVVVRMVGIQNGNIKDLAAWTLWIMKQRVFAADSRFRGKVLGTFQLETRENTKGKEATASCTYKVQPDNTREGVLQANPAAQWSTILSGPLLGAIVNAVTPPTLQQATPLASSPFPWVGFGTSGPSNTNPGFAAEWANPSGSVGGPPDGVGILAASVSLFAAMLNDPCQFGSLSATPMGDAQDVDLRNNPSQYNTLSSGQGSQAQLNAGQASASLSAFTSTQIPATINAVDILGLSQWDGLPGAYDHWQVLNEYIDEPGVLVMPTGDPSGSNMAVAFASAEMTLVKRWTARRDGAPPTLPPKASQDPNFIYIGGSGPNIRELEILGDSSSLTYEANGIYKYKAINADVVLQIADIPPMMPALLVQAASQWATGISQLVGGPGNGQIENPP